MGGESLALHEGVQYVVHVSCIQWRFANTLNPGFLSRIIDDTTDLTHDQAKDLILVSWPFYHFVRRISTYFLSGDNMVQCHIRDVIVLIEAKLMLLCPRVVG